MLKLVLGASGTGKSNYLMDRICERAQRGEKSILLVPEQFTSSTESRIYQALGDEGSGFVESYSFSSLAEKLLRTYGGAAVQSLTDAGRVVLVRRAVESVSDHLRLYSRHRHSIAFCVKCAETLNEFKSAGITPMQLAQLAEGAEVGSEKLAELAVIFAAYEALLEGAAMDPSDRLEMAAARAEPEFFEGKAVFVDEFDTFNAPKRSLLEKILLWAPDVSVALCCDGLEDHEQGMGLFSGAKQVAASLRILARHSGVPVAAPVILEKDWRHEQSPALAALEKIIRGKTPENCPKGDAGITLLCCETRAEEAKRTAAAIRKLAQKGVPYGRMAVICRESEDYLAPLRYELRLAGIPYFFDGATTAEQAAPLRLVRALLGLLRRGLCTSEVLAAAKTGLVDLPEQSLCALENYAYTWKLSAAQWRETFTLSPRGFGAEDRPEDRRQLALAEEARSFLIPILDDFCTRAKNQTAEGLCKRIYETMCALGGEKRVAQTAEELAKTDGIPARDETLRAWNLAVQLLDELALLLGDEQLAPARCAELFELLARTSDLGHIPQSLDQVIFTTASRMRLDNPECCFVLGLAEGEFPRVPGESGLLTHAERESIIRQNVEMPDCFESQLGREQVSFYKALTAPSRRLWLSWTTGSQALPVTGALNGVLQKLEPAEPVQTLDELAETPRAALDLLGQRWQPGSGETAALYRALDETEEGKELLKAIQNTAGRKPFQVKNRQVMEGLLGPDLRLSPSRMERYYSCPFAYFMEYVLGARPRRQAALTADQSGSLIHYILENALREAGEDFVNLTARQLEELAGRIADRYVAENMPGDQRRLGYLIERLKKSAAGVLSFIQSEQQQGRFVPVAFEMGIGGKDQLAPVVLTTPEGHKISMIGTIDRLDAFEDGEKTWMRVVDYKTGSKEFSLEDVANGINCQMLVYLFTVTRNGGRQFKNPVPAGVMYILADPAPHRQRREQAAEGLEYKVEGLVVDEEPVIRAMDRDATGLFVPITFDRKGEPRPGPAMASLEQMKHLEKQLEELVITMARRLYAGDVEASPMGKGRAGKTDCPWCDYQAVCGREEL